MRHPKGTRARVLLTSVFKPFTQDDEYGSRVLNPVELYHNQVTRAQGPFSQYLRAEHPSVSRRIRSLRLESERELGAMAVAINRAVGPLLHWASRRNARRHPAGRRLEPRTFVERRA